MRLPAFIPADEPATYMSGSGLVLKAEFCRPVTITCQACNVTTLKLKLLSNGALNADSCDRLLTEHLDTLGWSRLKAQGADICPECIGTKREVCPHCRDYTGGHTKTCPTQLPGALQ